MSDLLAIAGNLILGEGSTLNIVGAADGVTTYTLATFNSVSNTFETVMGIPGGYTLVYNANDIELVPIPEPSTWIAGALILGALAFYATPARASLVEDWSRLALGALGFAQLRKGSPAGIRRLRRRFPSVAAVESVGAARDSSLTRGSSSRVR